MNKEERLAMIDKNMAAFRALLPDLSSEMDKGKYGVMRHEKLAGIFDNAADAHSFAHQQYQDNQYSVHEVIHYHINLGNYSVRQ